MKTSLKFLLILSLVFTGLSLFFVSGDKVSAQTEVSVSTTWYSALSDISFVFGGYYSGNFDKKGFTTYFEYKEDDYNTNSINLDSSDLLEYFDLLDKDKQETIKIVRNSNVEQAEEFYSNPELQLFSTYHFRAVGYFNDNPNERFYGNVMSLRTGYIPPGVQYPFTRGAAAGGEDAPTCMPPEAFNVLTNSCDTPAKTCTSGEIYSFASGDCINLSIPTCNAQQSYDIASNTCINRCTWPEIYSLLQDECISATSDPTNPNTPTTPDSGGGGLVKCGKSDANGNIPNPCDFNDIIILVGDVIDFIIKYMVLPISAIMFAYAGFELMTSGGSTEKKSKAKKIFTSVAIGLIVVAGAWLIVNTVLSIVGYTGETFLK